MDLQRVRNFISAQRALLLAIAVVSVVATACGSTAAAPAATRAPEPTATRQPQPTATVSTPTPSPIPEPVPTEDPGPDLSVFEELNPRPELRAVDRSIDFGFDEREALPRDLINPIYSPKFVDPEEVEDLILDEELVMGLNINGDARAYPVGIMRFREIVNDEVGGIPLLVTW